MAPANKKRRENVVTDDAHKKNGKPSSFMEDVVKNYLLPSDSVSSSGRPVRKCRKQVTAFVCETSPTPKQSKSAKRKKVSNKSRKKNVQTHSKIIEKDSRIIETDSRIIKTDSRIIKTDSRIIETDSRIIEDKKCTEKPRPVLPTDCVLTPRRQSIIINFMKKNEAEIKKFGEIGSEMWFEELVKSLGKPAGDEQLTNNTVRKWLQLPKLAKMFQNLKTRWDAEKYKKLDSSKPTSNTIDEPLQNPTTLSAQTSSQSFIDELIDLTDDDGAWISLSAVPVQNETECTSIVPYYALASSLQGTTLPEMHVNNDLMTADACFSTTEPPQNEAECTSIVPYAPTSSLQETTLPDVQVLNDVMTTNTCSKTARSSEDVSEGEAQVSTTTLVNTQAQAETTAKRQLNTLRDLVGETINTYNSLVEMGHENVCMQVLGYQLASTTGIIDILTSL